MKSRLGYLSGRHLGFGLIYLVILAAICQRLISPANVGFAVAASIVLLIHLSYLIVKKDAGAARAWVILCVFAFIIHWALGDFGFSSRYAPFTLY